MMNSATTFSMGNPASFLLQDANLITHNRGVIIYSASANGLFLMDANLSYLVLWAHIKVTDVIFLRPFVPAQVLQRSPDDGFRERQEPDGALLL